MKFPWPNFLRPRRRRIGAATITEDLTLFQCMREHQRQNHERLVRTVRRARIGKETHILA